jgi:hypothetical protein
MQKATNDMMNQMGLGQLHFVVMADLAMKFFSLMWKAHPKGLLSLGIHPFCIGKTSPDAIAQLQELAQQPYGCPGVSGHRQGLNPTEPHLARCPKATILGA